MAAKSNRKCNFGQFKTSTPTLVGNLRKLWCLFYSVPTIVFEIFWVKADGRREQDRYIQKYKQQPQLRAAGDRLGR